MRAKGFDLAVFAISLAFLGGCGGDDDDGSGGSTAPSHGVEGSKPASTLTQAEIDAICADIDRRGTAAASSMTAGLSDETICTISGLAAAAMMTNTPQECESVKDTCLQMINQPGTGVDAGVSPGLACPTVQELQNCTATVSEIDACVSADIQAAQQAAREFTNQLAQYENLTCNDVGTVDLTAASTDYQNISYQPPPECQTVEQKCPGVSLYF